MNFQTDGGARRAAAVRSDFDDKPREACGLFGIHGHADAARLTYFGLYAVQHRGQESAGIAVSRDKTIVAHKGMGLVPEVFDDEHLDQLAGTSAVGHVRYSTTGSSILNNAQPFAVRHRQRAYAVGHNGNIVNAQALKNELEEAGSIFQTTMDSEIFLHLFVKSLRYGFQQALVEATTRLKGAFSLVMLTSRGEVIGIRDPHGFRPCVWANSTAATSWHRKPAPSTWFRRSSSGSWTPVKSSSSATAASSRSTPARRTGRPSAFSSSSISPGPTASSAAATSTRHARPTAAGWPRRPRWRPIW
jgi:amidophosphoribosyltransferase